MKETTIPMAWRRMHPVAQGFLVAYAILSLALIVVSAACEFKGIPEAMDGAFEGACGLAAFVTVVLVWRAWLDRGKG